MSESKVNHRDPPPIIPQELLGKTFICEQCGEARVIDWQQKQPFPKDSVASKVKKGNWVPVSFLNTCSCTHANHVKVETKEFSGSLFLSADEASRRVNDIYMFLLAGCGVSPNKQDYIADKIYALEQDLEKESEGRIKEFHAKEIMSSKSWPNATKVKRLKFIRKMSAIARSNRVSKFVTAGAIHRPTSSQMKYLRDQVFSAYTMRSLDLCTNSGIRPIFGFDETQNGKKNGWAEECMIGIRRYPLFVWHCRGAHIEDIKHVKPGSSIESKLADCLAFVTAREFDRRVSGSVMDVDTRWYARSFFSGYDAKGDLIFSDGVGYPWNRVFGLKSKR